MTISIPILTEFNDKGVKSAVKSLKGLVQSQVGASLSAAGLVEVSKRAIQAANEDARSQRLLASAIVNNTTATYDQIKGVEEYIGKLQYSALIADDELRPALAQLVTVTEDVSKAQDLMKIAIDAAAYTGRDLATTSNAISKAFQGQVGALRKLGLRISDTTIQSKDFEQAMREVASQTKDANKIANDGAEKGWKKLGIAIADVTEKTGVKLNEAISNTVEFQKAVDYGTTRAQRQTETLIGTGATATRLARLWQYFFGGIREEAQKAQDTLDKFASQGNRYIDQLTQAYWANRDALDKQAAAEKKAAAAREKARAAAQKLAEANRTLLANALQAAQSRLEELTQTSNQYRDSLRDTVSAYVSLSDAVSGANSSETAYNDALAERKAAYEELAKLQTTVFDAATGQTTVADANDLADAMERVAKAETAVGTAQKNRKTYTESFREQIGAAISFSQSLKQLVDNGLEPAGLQQLLNLGPVAGAQVAKDILAGVGGLTVGQLNSDLNTVASYGNLLGGASAGQQYGAAILGAQQAVGAVQQGQAMNVTIQATSADPDKVVEALVTWAKRNGTLPKVIKVS